MAIGKVVTSGFNVVANYIKKNPKTTAVVAGGLVGGLILGKALTTSRKKVTQDMNRLILTNPMLNPTGWMTHMLDVTNPNPSPNGLDSIVVKHMAEKNNKNYRDYYNNLDSFERVKEFYDNGGKGFNMS